MNRKTSFMPPIGDFMSIHSKIHLAGYELNPSLFDVSERAELTRVLICAKRCAQT